MKKTICMIILGLVILPACTGKSRLVKFVAEGGLETKGLVNLALASNGARVFVSQSNPEHPAETLINGITSSENWDQGEGWEAEHEGRFARGRYLYGSEDPGVLADRRMSDDPTLDDPSWRGLRVQTRRGESIDTALGWVIIDFPEEKTVNRAIIHTIDSAEYPAEKFGVRDVALQYWLDVVGSWASVERLGKDKMQSGNSIRNNEDGVITFRFEPVKTPRMRLVIRWTNDSKTYRSGYYTYANGTVRLLEIEIYGYERDESAEAEAAEATATMIQDANEIAEIEIVIDNYVDGYNRQNVDMLMSSISPDYSKDDAKYSDLKEKMESVFAEYEQTKLELQDVKVQLTDAGATATSMYTARYEQSADGSPSVSSSGTLVFELSDKTGYWKITRIDQQ